MKLFLTGANGFIGSSVAQALLKDGHEIRGLIRDPQKADQIAKLGITPVIGTLEDADLLETEARASEGVINAASSDHRGAVEALIRGLEGSGKPFLHTSGSSIVSDEAMGESSDKTFTESTPIQPAPDKVARASLDRFVLNASEKGVRTVVLCNTLIYGRALGVAAESVQVPALIRQAKASGVARYIGRGQNRWSNVHIEDVAQLYVLALKNAKAGTFLYVENGEDTFENITQAIAQRFHLGTPKSWPANDAINEWGRELAVFALGSNSRVRGHVAREELGWKPKRSSVTKWILEEA